MGTGEFRRRYERKNYNSDIVFSLRGKAFAGTLKDISMGGAFVMALSVNQVHPGDVVTISIPFTSGTKSMKRRARVLWTSGEGFAVEFF
ncbi:PilZ domain-containing protein [uncultured Desulfosarcina sp.]|uniref:PilZ domain-containing protein n=1 Tax=uncultured Desulfosarcina sp. TaxID=218289 RepID=UPI0029C748D7|nr:PilZ domain-containing protein [uncultured Desulfosarcina sp.]